MGKRARNRGKHNQENNLQNGHSPQASPRTAPQPQGRPVNDFLNINISDRLAAATAGPAGQEKPPETGYSASESDHGN